MNPITSGEHSEFTPIADVDGADAALHETIRQYLSDRGIFSSYGGSIIYTIYVREKDRVKAVRLLRNNTHIAKRLLTII